MLYDTDEVPVGDDQRQHIGSPRHRRALQRPLRRHLRAPARWCAGGGDGPQRPDDKMSKSLESPKGTVNLLDPPKQIEKKIRRGDRHRRRGPLRSRHQARRVERLTNDPRCGHGPEIQLADDYTQYGPLKADTAAAVVALLEPLRAP
ncbi:MAG: hypothetical protein R2695_17465 [Acidimicrobiales bacterium]